MAKNRTSIVNPLEGLANISKTATVIKKEVNESIKAEEKPEEIIAKEKIVNQKSVEQSLSSKKKKTKTEEAKKFTVYIPPEDYMFIKKNGWEFNGMNGFIVHLIEEERKKRGE